MYKLSPSHTPFIEVKKSIVIEKFVEQLLLAHWVRHDHLYYFKANVVIVLTAL